MTIPTTPATVSIELDPEDLAVVVGALRDRALDVRRGAAAVWVPSVIDGHWLQEAIDRGIAEIIADAEDLEHLADQLEAGLGIDRCSTDTGCRDTASPVEPPPSSGRTECLPKAPDQGDDRPGRRLMGMVQRRQPGEPMAGRGATR